ncbi:leucyl aminopeptidase [Piscinibacter sp.]|uniref:leucyl aminopeptidase n=1 Tax=Piscinibacter sp. TaxID=1903157 RepID=UPI0039E61DC7
MDFRHQGVSPDALATVACDALLLVVAGDQADAVRDAAVKRALDDALAHGEFELKRGKTVYLHRPSGLKAPRLVLAACGTATPQAVKAAFAAGLAALKGGGSRHVAVALAGAGEASAAQAEALVAAVNDATYVYRHTKPSAPAAGALSRVTLLAGKGAAKAVAQGLARGQAVAAGVTLARELGNRPGNHCTPSDLGDQAKKLGKAFGLKVEVLDRKAIEKLGMGAFLAVAQGSAQPPRFIVAQYQGAPKSQPPVVLVGKGITFDTGGISIKPAAEMDEMKFDMGGAASVLGTLRAVAELKPRLNLVVLVPTTENMPGGRAVKPGDVVTSLSGQTIEILNTDAEGRLVLCDALTYAERFKPACVVDVATLTGACVIALGHHHTGLFSADDRLATALLAAGAEALDPCWRMPLDEEYDEALKSNFADMGNVGGRAGGAITAAMFLRRFTGRYRWAHLDIAGTAWKSGAAKGATGRPVALLTHFVLSQAG